MNVLIYNNQFDIWSIKRHSALISALKSITHGSTQELSPTEKHLLYGYKESVHPCAYEPNSTLQRITR